MGRRSCRNGDAPLSGVSYDSPFRAGVPMADDVSRREWLRAVGAAGAAGAAGIIPSAEPLRAGAAPQGTPILPLVSTTDIFVPGRGRTFNSFSFDFPEPSVEFAGFRFGFRVFTRENVYSLDLDKTTAEGTADRLTLSAGGLV